MKTYHCCFGIRIVPLHKVFQILQCLSLHQFLLQIHFAFSKAEAALVEEEEEEAAVDC